MRGPKIIDLLREPDGVKPGDIVSFNHFPEQTGRIVMGSSRLLLRDFQASTKVPRYRGYVAGMFYDSQNDDQPISLIVLPLASIDKTRRIENDPKNLMISNIRQIKIMGLDETRNWRLCYMPTRLDLTGPNFGFKENSKVMKTGHAPPDLATLISDHIGRLAEERILDTMNIARGRTAHTLRGERGDVFSKIVGGEVGSRQSGSRADMEAAERAEQRLRDKRKEERKARMVEAREAFKALRETPSGGVAFKLGRHFSQAAEKDISLDAAFEHDLLNEEQFIVLSTLSEENGNTTLRHAYDGFVQDHQGTMALLVQLGECSEDEQEEYKAALEKDLKEALTSFYQKLGRNDQNEKPSELADVAISHERKPEGP